MGVAADREAEWSNILDLGTSNKYFAYWLKERADRYRLGQPTDNHTKIIRSEYRRFLRGEIGEDGLPAKGKK